MILERGKRKIEYHGADYYWYVRVDEHSHRVHIMSEDKKVHLQYPFLDTEVPVTPGDIREHLEEYYRTVL